MLAGVRAGALLLLLGLAGCDEDYNSAAQGVAHCFIEDETGSRCHQYTWRSPTARNELAATCVGVASQFDENQPCPDGAVGVCTLDAVATYVYPDYTALAGFDATCAEGGGTYEDVGCAAAGGAGPAVILLGLLGLARRRRR
jgi:uncharacterized protein (TIGR03382 family)